MIPDSLRRVLRKADRAVELAPELIRRPSRVSQVARGVHPSVLISIDQPWLRDLKVRTILDVGANTGQFAKASHAVFPGAQIYAFEPLPSCFAEMQLRMKDVSSFKAFQAAIGSDDASVTIHESASSPSSSILSMTSQHTEAFPWTAGGQDIEVPLRRLDSFLPELTLEGPVLLKVDVQGYSLEVLRGASEILGSVDLIIVETSVETLYDGEATFDQVYSVLKAADFEFAGVLDQLQHPVTRATLQVDAIFRRRIGR